MVRLVRDDFLNVEDNHAFYSNNEVEKFDKMIWLKSLKVKHVELPSIMAANNEIYSLINLSKQYLSKNQLLVSITDEDYIILFNHKTVYSAKVNIDFLIDDIIKSILINKHISRLSMSEENKTLHYIVSSKFKDAIEYLFEQNTKNENNKVIAKSLGDIDVLVKPLIKLDTYSTFFYKNLILLGLAVFSFYTLFFGLDAIKSKYFSINSLSSLESKISLYKRFIKKETINLKKVQVEYKEIISCLGQKENND